MSLNFEKRGERNKRLLVIWRATKSLLEQKFLSPSSNFNLRDHLRVSWRCSKGSFDNPWMKRILGSFREGPLRSFDSNFFGLDSKKSAGRHLKISWTIEPQISRSIVQIFLKSSIPTITAAIHIHHSRVF